MAQITWRNIDAPRFAESAAMYESAGRQLTDAFKGISGAAQELEATQVRDNTNRYLMGALQAQDADQLSAFMQGEGAGILAAAGSNIDPSALLQAQQLKGSLTALKTDELRQGEMIQNRDALAYLNQYAHEASLGNTVSPEILAQALQHQQFSNVAPVINQGNLQRELSAAQHADDMRIKQQQLSDARADNTSAAQYRNLDLQLKIAKLLGENATMTGPGRVDKNGKVTLAPSVLSDIQNTALSNFGNPSKGVEEFNTYRDNLPKEFQAAATEAYNKATKESKDLFAGTSVGKTYSNTSNVIDITGDYSAFKKSVGNIPGADPEVMDVMFKALTNLRDNTPNAQNIQVDVNALQKALAQQSAPKNPIEWLADWNKSVWSLPTANNFDTGMFGKAAANSVVKDLIGSGALYETEYGVPFPAKLTLDNFTRK